MERTVGADLTRADFSRDTLRSRHFQDCRLVGADLSEASLTGVVFERCDLSGAELTSAQLRDCALLSCRLDRARLFGARLKDCKLTGSTFLRCSWRPVTVDGGDWSYTALRGEDLQGTSLDGVRLVEADLSDADLRRCSLRGTDLSRARLRGARLRGADLRGATLEGCDVDGVDWAGVRIDLVTAVLLARPGCPRRGRLTRPSGAVAAQQGRRPAQTAQRGSCRQVPVSRCCTTGSSNPPACRCSSATTSGRSDSSSDSQPRTALVGKHRLLNVHTLRPPGRRTRATSASTSTGRVR